MMCDASQEELDLHHVNPLAISFFSPPIIVFPCHCPWTSSFCHFKDQAVRQKHNRCGPIACCIGWFLEKDHSTVCGKEGWPDPFLHTSCCLTLMWVICVDEVCYTGLICVVVRLWNGFRRRRSSEWAKSSDLLVELGLWLRKSWTAATLEWQHGCVWPKRRWRSSGPHLKQSVPFQFGSCNHAFQVMWFNKTWRSLRKSLMSLRLLQPWSAATRIASTQLPKSVAGLWLCHHFCHWQ